MIELLTALLVIATGAYAWLTFKLLKTNKDVLMEMRNQQIAWHRSDFFKTWNKLDELLLQYPNLSDIWLEPEDLEVIRKKYPGKQHQEEYFKRRALASIIMGIYFRDYQLRNQIQTTIGGVELEEVMLDNKELWRMWTEGAVKNDYSTFPDFVNFAEKYFFKNFINRSKK